MPICNKCNKAFSNRLNVNGKIRILSKRKFCLECSPFGQHNTRRLNLLNVFEKDEKNCPKCNKLKKGSEFYFRRNGKDFSVYCIDCTKQESLNRQRKLKKALVLYKGGKCQCCHFEGCIDNLTFHHYDMRLKEFTISGTSRSLDEMKKEVDKCILLCRMCHGAIHSSHTRKLRVTGDKKRMFSLYQQITYLRPRTAIAAVCFFFTHEHGYKPHWETMANEMTICSLKDAGWDENVENIIGKFNDLTIVPDIDEIGQKSVGRNLKRLVTAQPNFMHP